MSIMILVFVVLGGIGNMRGSIIAAVILTLLPELLRGLSDYRMLIYAIVLILMMLFNWAPKSIEWREKHSFRRLTAKRRQRRRQNSMALLEVKNLGISFGGLRAVNAVDMNIEAGQLYGLIGPNGAGKTTFFNLLTGVYKPDEGIVRLGGKDITGKRRSRSTGRGLPVPFRISVCLKTFRYSTT